MNGDRFMAHNINELDLFIGAEIRSLRKKMKWGLKCLAFKLNISVQQLQKYEIGANKVSASLLYEITQIFNVPIDLFFSKFTENKNAIVEHKSFNILLIEDDINDEFVIRETTIDFPQRINLYSVNEGNKVLDFLSAFARKSLDAPMKPDIILLGLHLSHINSFDILRAIKKDQSLSSIPVIILANNANRNDAALSYSLSAGGFIVKAHCQENFKEQIHNLLLYWTNAVTLPQECYA